MGNTVYVVSVHIPLQVRTLRGHESDIVSAVVMSGRGGGGDVDWENPAPPVVVSLSTDGCVKAWDVMQVRSTYIYMYMYMKYIYTHMQYVHVHIYTHAVCTYVHVFLS